MKNLFLYISAFIPMYFLILVEIIIEIINGNLHFNILNTLNMVTMIILILVGITGLIWNIKWTTEKAVDIEILSKSNITDQHFLGYFSLFVLFSLSFDLSKVSMFCLFSLILIMIGIVYIKNDLYYINPFLNILGYNFYDITYTFKNSEKVQRAKIFYKGSLDLTNKTYCVKFKNNNFSFLTPCKQKPNKKSKD